MKFSIITPSYKQVDYLSLCAKSVEDQTGNFQHEHIIQNGGSGTEFDEWAAGQNFSIIYKEKDSGMYDAINRGFKKAKGDILAWLNCGL
ncbi:MAG: glycosyltransferase [Verrucomicrobiae bacterium]|nr:glycosyltransferase [Verrucomicrobiae bacterium]NNJ43609.1 glycosyltransferase [Akkermansiaceae bacterium]